MAFLFLRLPTFGSVDTPNKGGLCLDENFSRFCLTRFGSSAGEEERRLGM